MAQRPVKTDPFGARTSIEKTIPGQGLYTYLCYLFHTDAPPEIFRDAHSLPKRTICLVLS
jgi:hypothetical protein